jgi:hypothetical protein
MTQSDLNGDQRGLASGATLQMIYTGSANGRARPNEFVD